MAKCGCAGSGCSCNIVAGRGVSLRGVGSISNPFVLEVEPVSFQVTDTPSVNLSLSGSGIEADPYVLSAEYVGGEVPVWVPSISDSWNGSVDLSSLTEPTTVRATLINDVTSVTLPTWDADKLGVIHLILAQDGSGGHTWVTPGTTAGGAGILLSTGAGARDYITLTWTGTQWIAEPRAMDIS